MTIAVNTSLRQPMTLNQPIDEFRLFLLIQKRQSKNTADAYVGDIRQFCTQRAITMASQVDDTVVHDYLSGLYDQALSPLTIYRKLVALNQFWVFLKRHGVSHNPWHAIRRPRRRQTMPPFIEQHTMMELLDAYPTHNDELIRNKAILELLFSSGIRVGELVNLSIQHLELDQHQCRVIGKGNKMRMALFGQRARHAITMYMTTVRPRWVTPATSAVFLSKQGRPLSARTVQRVVHAANQYHGSPIQITPHTCRHTCASLLIQHGADIRQVQDFLGHASIATTQRYTHIPTHQLTRRFLGAMGASIEEST